MDSIRTSHRRTALSFLGTPVLALALIGLIAAAPGCTTRVSSDLPAPTAANEESGPTPAELREEIDGAHVELAGAKEDLGALVQQGATVDAAALDAILERLESAESRLDAILERADQIESAGGE